MLPVEFTTLEEAQTSYIEGKQKASKGFFHQSDVAARTCTEKNREAWGMSDKEILNALGSVAEDSYTTVYGRLLVGRVFPRGWREADENVWCKRKFWSHFEVCARTWSEDDPQAPYVWLSFCVEHDLSVNDLKLAIKDAGGGSPPEHPVFLMKARRCHLKELTKEGMALGFDKPLEISFELPDEVDLIITALVAREPLTTAPPAELERVIA